MNRNPNSPPADDSKHDARIEIAPLVAPTTSALTRVKSALGIGIAALAWLVVIVLSAGALARVFLHDRWIPLVWFNAFSWYVYLPAYCVALYAAWGRRWRLGALAAVVILFHVIWVGIDLLPIRRGSAAPRGAAEDVDSRTYRIYFHNVHGFGDGYEGTFAEMMDADADVVIFTELAWRWRRAAMEQEILAKLPFSTLGTPNADRNTALFSKFPITNITIHKMAPYRTVIEADIALDDATLKIFSVHCPRPLLGDGSPTHGEYYAFADRLVKIVARATGPRVVIGDFNATTDSRLMKKLEASGLRNAHIDVGRGFATTWPNGASWLPPIRIDHALVSPEIESIGIWEGIGADSDHKPIVLDIRVHPG